MEHSNSSTQGEAHRIGVEGFEGYSLSAGAYGATVVPSLGMLCTSFTWNGGEHLHARATCQAFAEQGTTTGIPFLFPWANRLGGLAYVFNDTQVTLDPSALPITVVDPGGAIHGLHQGALHWRDDGPPPDSATSTATLRAHLDFTPDCPTFAAYPFPHRIELECILSPEGLLLRTTVHALSDIPVPVAFGFHPYLCLPDSPREEWMLDVPVNLEYPLRDMIPSGTPMSCPALSGPLSDRTFDSCFVMPSQRITLSSHSMSLHLEADRAYRCLQVYAPKGSPFICLEPMTAPPAPFQSGLGSPAVVVEGSPFTAAFTLACSAL